MKAKQNYYVALAVRYDNDKSKTWRLINEISNRKRRSNSSVKSLINCKGEKLADPKQIANCLNEHFSVIGENMAQKFENIESVNDPLDYINCEVRTSANLSPTSNEEISQLIASLQNKKSMWIWLNFKSNLEGYSKHSGAFSNVPLQQTH